MEIKIRLATSGDIDAVENLYNELNDYLATHENGPRWKKGGYPIREHAEVGVCSEVLYVAVIGEEIVGSCIIEPGQGDAYRTVKWQIDFDVPYLEICKLAVHPVYFGCGVGKALLNHAEIVGRQLGMRAIRLDTYEENIPAVRLYEKCGYRCMGLVDLGLEKVYGLKWYKAFEKVLI